MNQSHFSLKDIRAVATTVIPKLLATPDWSGCINTTDAVKNVSSQPTDGSQVSIEDHHDQIVEILSDIIHGECKGGHFFISQKDWVFNSEGTPQAGLYVQCEALCEFINHQLKQYEADRSHEFSNTPLELTAKLACKLLPQIVHEFWHFVGERSVYLATASRAPTDRTQRVYAINFHDWTFGYDDKGHSFIEEDRRRNIITFVKGSEFQTTTGDRKVVSIHAFDREGNLAFSMNPDKSMRIFHKEIALAISHRV